MQIQPVVGLNLEPGQYTYPETGLYTGMDGTTDCTLTGQVLGTMHIEIELYENEEFQQVIDEMTFDGTGFVATGIHGRDGNNDPVAIFPENAGLRIRITVSDGGVSTLTLTTSP